MLQKNKIVAFVPIRLNSSRLPQKSIKLLGNKPLCKYILETLLSISEIDEVYVFASNPHIKQYLPKGVKFLSRPTSLDSHSTLGMDIYQEFIKKVEADVYLLAHVTSPFIKKSSIELGLQSVCVNQNDSAFSVFT